MKAGEARVLGQGVAARLRDGDPQSAYKLLAPVLPQKTPFPMLDRIGEAIGSESWESLLPLLDRIAGEGEVGGWPLIGSALKGQLGDDIQRSLETARRYIAAASVWTAADILGERAAGEALLREFRPTLVIMEAWRADPSPWVRRAIGVAVHYWGKRSRGGPELRPHASELLDLLQPVFGEWDMNAVKGVGWGLKTLGKHYPELVTDWLAQEVVPSQRRHRARMLRKALTYLTPTQRARVMR